MDLLSSLKQGHVLPCPVCAAPMGREVKAMSYGGVCCVSCRSFFRRAHEDTKEPNLTCMYKGCCQVTPRTRQHCARCRLNACLRSGMRPELVLTPEQRKARFQKSRAKKEGRALAKIAQNGQAEIEEKPRISGLSRPHLATEATDRSKMWLEAPPASADTSPSMSPGVVGMVSVNNLRNLSATQASPSIGDSDSPSSSSPSSSRSDDELRALLSQSLQRNLRDFLRTALAQRSVIRDLDDWRSLLRQNKRLWVNLILSQFLTANSFSEKVLWLKAEDELEVVVRARLSDSTEGGGWSGESVETLGLFRGDSVMMNVFLGFAQSMRNLWLTPIIKRELAKVLFLYQGSLSLNNFLVVNRSYLMSTKALNEAAGHLVPLQDIHEVGRNLEAMAALFEHSGLTGKYLPDYFDDVDLHSISVSLGFTVEESMWIDNQKHGALKILNTSVPVGSELISEFVCYAMNGSPLSMQFGYQTACIYKERFWKLFEMHEDFTSLSNNDQGMIVNIAHGLFAALSAAMTDDMPIDEVIRFGFSMEEIRQDHFLCMITEASPDECKIMKPIKFRGMYPYLPQEWDDALLRVQSFIHQKDNYMSFFAILIAVMFDPIALASNASGDCKSRWKGLEMLAMRHKMAFARKFGRIWSDYENQIRITIQNLRIMSNIINSTQHCVNFEYLR